jgi:flagellar FliL protein
MSQPEAAAATAPPPKRRSKLLVIGLPMFLLLVGCGAGAWWFFGRSAEAAAQHEEEVVPPGLLSLEPFIVNLADEGGRRFLRVSLQLLVAGEEEAKEIEENKLVVSRLRSAILELLTTQTSAHLGTAEGRSELKKKIAETAMHTLEHVKVTDVLFSEFVVQ